MVSVATRVRDKNEWKILQASLSSVWTLLSACGAPLWRSFRAFGAPFVLLLILLPDSAAASAALAGGTDTLSEPHSDLASTSISYDNSV